LHDRNYAMLFSFWDDLFGTAERKAPPPLVHGLPGNPIPETIFGQIAYPFVAIWRGFPRQEQAAAPPTGTPAE
jgi:sterol desaturase/sphingolipid hydroxylase (fatty acid hydroxylase superfamily)